MATTTVNTSIEDINGCVLLTESCLQKSGQLFLLIANANNFLIVFNNQISKCLNQSSYICRILIRHPI